MTLILIEKIGYFLLDDSELDMEIPYGEETTLTLNAAETNDLENG